MKDINTSIANALSAVSGSMVKVHNAARTQMQHYSDSAAQYGITYLSSTCCAQEPTPAKETSTAPTLVTNLSNFLQKQAFYLLFWGATHGLHTIVKNLVPDPYAYAVPAFSGAIAQGYYNCPTQRSLETKFPNISLATGALNGLACCLITSTILNPYLGAVVGGLAFMLCNDQLMCRVEGIALALSSRITESGLSLTTLKNLGKDFKDIATGEFVARLAREDTSSERSKQH